MASTHSEALDVVWSVADSIRDAGYHSNQYGDLILPVMVLRRLGQASQETRDKALTTAEKLRDRGNGGQMFDQAFEHAVGWTRTRPGAATDGAVPGPSAPGLGSCSTAWDAASAA